MEKYHVLRGFHSHYDSMYLLIWSVLFAVDQLSVYCKECRGRRCGYRSFDDGVDQATINSIGEQIKAYKGVTKVEYVSAEEAWDEWSKQYFGNTELASEMAEGFKNDNPLANSSSYSVYVDKIEHQDALVKYIEGLDGVREVNQLKGATQTLSSFNTLLTYISVAIILILLCVAVFLISNTVAIGISIRKEEIGIMKLIGATNFFVRAPFLIEGMIIGLIRPSFRWYYFLSCTRK